MVILRLSNQAIVVNKHQTNLEMLFAKMPIFINLVKAICSNVPLSGNIEAVAKFLELCFKIMLQHHASTNRFKYIWTMGAVLFIILFVTLQHKINLSTNFTCLVATKDLGMLP